MGESYIKVLIPKREDIERTTTLKEIASLVRNGINVSRTLKDAEAIQQTEMAATRLKQFLLDSDATQYQEFAESYEGWKELLEAADKDFPELGLKEIVYRLEKKPVWLIPTDERLDSCTTFVEAVSIAVHYAMPTLRIFADDKEAKRQCRKVALLVERLIPTQKWEQLERNSEFWMVAWWSSVNFPEIQMNEVIPFPII